MDREKKPNIITLTATADWSSTPQGDGFRPLRLDFDGTTGRNAKGALRVPLRSLLKIKVQIVDHDPNDSIILTKLNPKRLVLLFCPSLRTNRPKPTSTPFDQAEDHQLREGLTDFLLLLQPPPNPSKLAEYSFNPELKHEGLFEFGVSLSLSYLEKQLSEPGEPSRPDLEILRRFRADPEMDVGETDEPISPPQKA